jgi:4-hydroxy-2-oxoglutarate aldolase
MNPMNLQGVFAPVPTAFDDRDEIDLQRMRLAWPRWLRSGLAGFVVLGTNGEAATLDDEECDRMVDASRAHVPAGRFFLVGAGRESTRATMRAAKRAADLGADAVLVRTPGFFKAQMTGEALARHYLMVAEHSPVPVLLYNFTPVTGVTLEPPTVARLAEHPNIIGMKESGGDIARIGALVTVAPRLRVMAGSATTFYRALKAGARGGILALACVLPDACVRLFELAREEREEEAARLQEQLAPLSRLTGSTYGVPGLKAAMALVGVDVGPPRPPLISASPEIVDQLKQALARLEVLA